MSESLGHDAYAVLVRRLNASFAGSPERLAELESHGLVATNNLGLRMQVFDQGPESTLWNLYASALFTPRMCLRLERVRAFEPELWRQALDAYKLATLHSISYGQRFREAGPDDPRTHEVWQQLVEVSWEDTALRSQVFAVIAQEPLTEVEAVALCQ